MKYRILFFAFALGLAGCEFNPASEAALNEVNSGEKVLVTAYNVPLGYELLFSLQNVPDTTIKSVDGEIVKSGDQYPLQHVTVMPGKRTLKLHCSGEFDDERVSYTDMIEIDAVIGYKYTIYTLINSDKSCFFEVKKETLGAQA